MSVTLTGEIARRSLTSTADVTMRGYMYAIQQDVMWPSSAYRSPFLYIYGLWSGWSFKLVTRTMCKEFEPVFVTRNQSSIVFHSLKNSVSRHVNYKILFLSRVPSTHTHTTSYHHIASDLRMGEEACLLSNWYERWFYFPSFDFSCRHYLWKWDSALIPWTLHL